MTVTIRLAKREDAPQLLEIYRQYVEKTAISFEHQTPSLAEFQERMEKIQSFYPYLVLEEAGVLLGYAYAGPFRSAAAYMWAVESTIYLDPKERGRGLGQALYQQLEGYLEQMGIRSINACIGVGPIDDSYITEASKCFHARIGYKEVAHFTKIGYKFGRWYDMIWMEKKLAGSLKEGQKPLSVDQVLNSI